VRRVAVDALGEFERLQYGYATLCELYVCTDSVVCGRKCYLHDDLPATGLYETGANPEPASRKMGNPILLGLTDANEMRQTSY
jgi:hypothetical protein